VTVRDLTMLSGDTLRRADELLDRANHDVAKYMSMTARNVEPSAIDDELTEMMRRDLTQTNGSASAWALWRPLSAALSELVDDTAVGQIDEGMSTLESLVVRWTNNDETSGQIAEATVAVADRIAELRRSVRRAMMEQGR
jgi:hypothetical protein